MQTSTKQPEGGSPPNLVRGVTHRLTKENWTG